MMSTASNIVSIIVCEGVPSRVGRLAARYTRYIDAKAAVQGVTVNEC